MSRFAGRHSDAVTAAIHAARRARRNRCTCHNPYENGPFPYCEHAIDEAEDFYENPPADVEEDGLDRAERMFEAHLDRMGGSL